MRSFGLFLSVFLSFTMVGFAQSGRRVSATPSPTPNQPISQQSSQNDGEKNYSESKPLPKRAVLPLPSIRNVPKTDSKTQSQSQSKDAEVLSDSEDEVVKVETNLITIPVSVFDRSK